MKENVPASGHSLLHGDRCLDQTVSYNRPPSAPIDLVDTKDLITVCVAYLRVDAVQHSMSADYGDGVSSTIIDVVRHF